MSWAAGVHLLFGFGFSFGQERSQNCYCMPVHLSHLLCLFASFPCDRIMGKGGDFVELFENIFLTKSEKRFIRKVKNGYLPSSADRAEFRDLYNEYGFIETRETGFSGVNILSADFLTPRYEKYCIYRRQHLFYQLIVPVLVSLSATLVLNLLQWLLSSPTEPK